MGCLGLDIDSQGPYTFSQVEIDVYEFFRSYYKFNVIIFMMRNKHAIAIIPLLLHGYPFFQHVAHKISAGWADARLKYLVTNPPKSAPQVPKTRVRQHPAPLHCSCVVATLTITTKVPGTLGPAVPWRCCVLCLVFTVHLGAHGWSIL